MQGAAIQDTKNDISPTKGFQQVYQQVQWQYLLEYGKPIPFNSAMNAGPFHHAQLNNMYVKTITSIIIPAPDCIGDS